MKLSDVQIRDPFVVANEQDRRYTEDGGHVMLFYTFKGQLILSLHGPNKTPNERATFIPIQI